MIQRISQIYPDGKKIQI